MNWSQDQQSPHDSGMRAGAGNRSSGAQEIARKREHIATES
jgi:hypothetical protein